MNKKSFILLIPIVLASISWVVLPGVFSDSAFGFLVLKSMEEGAGFNTGSMPDPENIAEDRQEFMTWWSPGQYLVPSFVTQLGLIFGRAIVLTVLLSTILGLWGWLRVAQKAGAGKWAQIFFLLGIS